MFNVIGGAFLGDNFNNALFVNQVQKTTLYVSLEGSNSNIAGIGSRLKFIRLCHPAKSKF
ncbi:MAG: hypothetical protein R2784_06175 [Saprospiraceae bacterium]